MSNAGAVSAPVGNGEKLAPVRAFAQEFFDGLEEEPLREADLSGAACAFGAERSDDDFLGRAGKCGERQGFEFGGGLGSAEERFNAADFVEVGHARGGVSKWIHHGGHGERGGIRMCAAVQAWLGFARNFSNTVENTALFFQRGFVGNMYAFSRQKNTRQVCIAERPGGSTAIEEESNRDSVKRVGLEIHDEFVFLSVAVRGQ